MSLDITLRSKDPITKECSHCGSRYENYEYLFDTNITHNLGAMAKEAGIYEALWRPYRLQPGYNIPEDDYKAESEFESNAITTASSLIPIITKGLSDMKARPEHYKKFDAKNKWGTYEQFIPWIEDYLNALIEYPSSIVIVSR